MITVVEDFLGYLIRRARYRHKPVDKIGRYLLQQPRYLSLDWLAREAAMNPRQFYRTFTERMGVSPKRYARIVQFDQTIKLKNASPGTDWLSISLYLGYCYYQHLTKDCKEFTGLMPAAFHREESRAPEHNFGHKET
jgi:methylphosphotriester-DNA--protein-cysteine methyltransferase